jgi:D-alanyl-D-alanine carboxypeptidase
MRAFCALGLIVVVASGCGGEKQTPLSNALDRVERAGVPGVLAFVRDGSRTTSAAVGYSDVGRSVKLRTTERFRVGSVTKTFVATVVLQLAAEHRLRIDDPVSRWLPGLLPDGDRITLRDLLAHRSGLPDVADDPLVLDGPRSEWSARRLVASIARRPRTAAPGASFQYSSTNYLVLGLVADRVTGRSLGSLLASRVFAPLRLERTAYVSGRIDGTHVHGYSRPSHQGVVDPAAQPRDLDGRSARWAGAAGDVVSTAPDLARFLAALLGGKLLPRAQLREMEAARSRYGLGLGVFTTPCGHAWGHTGNLNGVLTIAWSTRDARRQAIVMANTFPLTADADIALRALAVEAFCGRTG